MKRAFLTGAVLVMIAALALSACNKGGSSGSANAQSGGNSGGSGRGSITLTETDFKYAMTNDGSGIKLLEYIGDKGKEGSIIIPDTIEGFPVVALGDVDDLFYEIPDGTFTGFPTKGITSITIPDTVTFIGKGAFHLLTNLTSITFPKNLKVIGTDAFRYSGLTSVTIPDGVWISLRAFYECKNLTTVTLGENVRFRSDHAFAKNPELATVNIPSSVKFFSTDVTREYGTSSNTFLDCPKLSLAARKVITDAGYLGSF